MANDTLREEYEARGHLLDGLCMSLKRSMEEALSGLPHIDRIAARVKPSGSFLNKADTGRYSEPLEEIEDQVAARVLVYFESDIEQVVTRLRDRFSPVEDFRHEPPRDQEFGYLTHHAVFVIPNHLKPKGWADRDPMPTTFEAQVRTLFMHAYAEPQHNLAYKSAEELTRDMRKLLAWIAASAWGADRAYQQVIESIHIASEGTSGTS